MINNIKIYKGKEIDMDKIKKIKDIAYEKYSPEIYKEYFHSINNLNDLAKLHDINIEDERLVLGSNWFLCYQVLGFSINLLEWISSDKENKMKQAIEMREVLSKLFIQNKDRLFCADMRPDTSYQIYLKLKDFGYFKEIYHEYIIDCTTPLEIKKIINIETTPINKEYNKYILHHIQFIVTNQFIDKYTKNKKKKLKKYDKIY